MERLRHARADGSRVVVAGLGLLLGFFTGSSAYAREPSVRLGLVVGAPVALTSVFDASERIAFQLALSPPGDRSELGLRVDVLLRLPELGGAVGSEEHLDFWVGLGWRSSLEANERIRGGPRTPVGVSLFLGDRLAELYAEIAPTLALHPERKALVEAGLGLRFGLF